MYIKIKNVSLEKILQKYNVGRVEDLDDEKLLLFCRELGLQESWIMSKKVKGRRLGLDRMKVIDNIINSCTYDDYMGTMFWEPMHDKLDRQYNLRENLKSHNSGNETFKMLENVKMGYSRLKPGEDRELQISKSWLDEYYINAPVTSFGPKGENPKIMIYDENGIILNKGYEPVKNETIEEVKKEEKQADVQELDWNIVRAMAKGYGIKTGGKSKQVIRDEVDERLKLEKKIN